MRSAVTACFLCFFFSVIQAQLYKHIEFEAFEKLMHSQSDTLYVINFWATWCKPCIAELPHFEQLQKETSKQNIKVILVSLDSESQWEKSLIPFLRKNNLTAQVLVLPNKKPVDWIDRIEPKWQGSIPATLFFNGAKNIRQFYEHEFTYNELKQIINHLKS